MGKMTTERVARGEEAEFRRKFSRLQDGGERTTCDPTWRPAIVYIATILSVLEGFEAVGRMMGRQWMGARGDGSRSVVDSFQQLRFLMTKARTATTEVRNSAGEERQATLVTSR